MLFDVIHIHTHVSCHVECRPRLKLNTGKHNFSDVSLVLFYFCSLTFLDVVLPFCGKASFICGEELRRLIQTLVYDVK